MERNYLDFTRRVQELLQQFPSLVDQLASKDVNFVVDYKKWLRDAEACLRSQQLPEIATLAGLRSRVLAAEQGLIEASSRERQRRKTARRVAAATLPEGEQVLQAVLRPRLQRVKEARRLLRTLLLLAFDRDHLRPMGSDDFQVYLHRILSSFEADAELKSGFTKVRSLVSRTDALRLLAEEAPAGKTSDPVAS